MKRRVFNKQGVAVFIFGMILFLAGHGSLSGQVSPYTPHFRFVIPDSTHWSVNLYYASDYVFMGRSDSIHAPYISPGVRYQHKSGFSIAGGLSYLTGTGQGRIDLYYLRAGYARSGNVFGYGGSVQQYFYNASSNAVASELSTYLSLFGSVDASVLTVALESSLAMGDDADIMLNGDISRTWYTFHNRLWITPTLSFYAGTQHYYDNYTMFRSSQSGMGHGGSGQGHTPDVRVTEASRFAFLDIDASMLVTYPWRSMRFYLAGRYAFPFHPAEITLDGTTVEEDLEATFVWSAGARMYFKR